MFVRFALPLLLLAQLSLAEQHTVTVQDFSFSPALISIAHGDTVNWNCISGHHNVRHLGNPSQFGNTAANAPWSYQFIFDDSGDSTFHYRCDIHPAMQGTVTVEPISGIDRAPSSVMPSVRLEQNYPNPFNGTTSIQFSLPVSSDVSLVLFNTQGREVRQLLAGYLASGMHQTEFDARGLAAGTYYYRLQTPQSTLTRPLIYLK